MSQKDRESPAQNPNAEDATDAGAKPDPSEQLLAAAGGSNSQLRQAIKDLLREELQGFREEIAADREIADANRLLADTLPVGITERTERRVRGLTSTSPRCDVIT